MKRIAMALCLFVACVTSCGAPEAINEVDVKQASGVVIALGMVGFTGDIDLTIRAVAAAFAKHSFGMESAGTQFAARGHINPAAVSPASMKAYLEAFKLLGIEDAKLPELADVPEDPKAPLNIETATEAKAEADGANTPAKDAVDIPSTKDPPAGEETGKTVDVLLKDALEEADGNLALALGVPTRPVRYVTQVNGDDNVEILGFDANGHEVSREVIP
jgi:hypothetical protein